MARLDSAWHCFLLRAILVARSLIALSLLCLSVSCFRNVSLSYVLALSPSRFISLSLSLFICLSIPFVLFLSRLLSFSCVSLSLHVCLSAICLSICSSVPVCFTVNVSPEDDDDSFDRDEAALLKEIMDLPKNVGVRKVSHCVDDTAVQQ